MVTLITYKAGFGEPSLSPFCVKAMWLLQAARVAWDREDNNDPRKMPYAKLPALRVGDQVIGDSHSIQAYLESTGADFWGDGADRSLGHALIRMAEEHIYFHLVLDRWANDEAWKIVRDTYFAESPGLIRNIVTGNIRKQTLKGLYSQGLGRFSPAERLERIEPDLQTFTNLMRDRPFLLGGSPSLPDYSVAAMINAIIATPVETLLSKRVKRDQVLSAYGERVAQHMGVSC